MDSIDLSLIPRPELMSIYGGNGGTEMPNVVQCYLVIECTESIRGVNQQNSLTKSTCMEDVLYVLLFPALFINRFVCRLTCTPPTSLLRLPSPQTRVCESH